MAVSSDWIYDSERGEFRLIRVVIDGTEAPVEDVVITGFLGIALAPVAPSSTAGEQIELYLDEK